MSENEKPKKERVPTVRTPSGETRRLFTVNPRIKSGAGRMRVTKKPDQPSKDSEH